MTFTEWCYRPRNTVGNLLKIHNRAAGSRDFPVNILCLWAWFAKLHNIFGPTRAVVSAGSRDIRINILCL